MVVPPRLVEDTTHTLRKDHIAMPGIVTSASDLPAPRGQRITIPDSASFPLTELSPGRLVQAAAFLDGAARIMRTRYHAPMDGCLNRSTCTPDDITAPICLLCALRHTIVGRTPPGIDARALADYVQTGSITVQLAIDTIDANPHHGGEVFVMDHLATYIRGTHTLTTTRK